jgi:TolB-like protein
MSPTEDDVRRQLDRLLASTVFANAGRMSRFLKFVVERTLAGDGERLKEYVIGVEVFDRAADYDPRIDSIVRVEAARLRSKLAEYYAGEGSSDAVVLTLPKGGYATVIKPGEDRGARSGAAPERNGAAPLANDARASVATSEHGATLRARRAWAAGTLLAVGAAVAVIAWAPGETPPLELRVAVLPFEPDTRDPNGAEVAQRLTEGVTAELVRDGRFSVVASSAARAEYSVGRRPREVAAALAADVVVEARITADSDRIRVEIRAAHGQTEQKLWVHGASGGNAGLDALEREIAAAIAEGLTTTAIARTSY